MAANTEPRLAQTSHTVNYQLPLFHSDCPAPVIHHKVTPLPSSIIVNGRSKPYGVSSPVKRSYRVLSPGLFRKRYDDVRDFLEYNLGLTTAQRDVILRLLRFWAYYGLVCPKESTVTSQPGCSKATYWRTVRFLKDRQLISVINRYVLRPHAQISNLYRFDRLMLILARYLAERGVGFLEKWLAPYLAMPARLFWGWAFGLAPSGGSG